MAALSTAKAIYKYMENAVTTFESQFNMLGKVKITTPSPGEFQDAGNFMVRNVQQRGASIAGFDLTGLETGVITEAAILGMGTPDNAFVSLRGDDLRNESYWIEQGKTDAKKRASVLNKAIIDSIRLTGSMFVRTNATSGFDAISLVQAAYNKRQASEDGRYIALTDSMMQTYGKDLAGRQTLAGQPDLTFQKGVLYPSIAGFDVMRSSSISVLAGGASPATTVTGNQSFSPVPVGSVSASGGTVTNIDYRSAVIPVAASAGYNVGDRVTFTNCFAVGRDDKTLTDELMTFTIVSKPNGTSIEVWPKPIAFDDPALSTLEKQYANINTRILNGVTVNRVNIDASTQPSVFWQKDSIEVISGKMPMDKFGEFAGKKVATETLSNGMTMYMLYDGDIASLQLKYRMFIWYGVNNLNPMDNGLLVKF